MSKSQVRRIISVDTGRGFAIFIMILVHVFTHQIGQGDSEMFIPLISSMSPILLVSLVPLIILGVWGSVFTFLSCIGLSANIFQMDSDDNRGFLKFILSRIIGGVLLVTIFRVLRYLTNFPDESFILRPVGPIMLNFGSGTLDSIAIVGVLVPIILIVIRKSKISKNVRLTATILISTAVISLGLSPFFISWGRTAVDYLHQKGWWLFEFVISKFIYGRFKIAHTFSFGIMGALLGYFIIMDVPERKFMIFSLIFFLVGMLILGISALIDWKFLLNFANEDVPIWVQIFNLGGQVGLFTVFMKYLEFAHNRRRHEKAVKLTIWLRRFGVVSLTIYTLGKFLGDGVFWLFEGIMGPAVDLSGINPILAWNMGEIYLVMATLIGIWFLVLQLWEKIEFIPSMEWILGLIAWILRMKKSPSLHVNKRVYIKNQIILQTQEISN